MTVSMCGYWAGHLKRLSFDRHSIGFIQKRSQQMRLSSSFKPFQQPFLVITRNIFSPKDKKTVYPGPIFPWCNFPQLFFCLMGIFSFYQAKDIAEPVHMGIDTDTLLAVYLTGY